MTIQDKIARKIFKYQNKLQSFNVKIKGTEIATCLLDIEEDKYGNTAMSLRAMAEVHCIFDFPMDEIPVSLSSTNSNTDKNSTQVLHLFELLPISCWFRNDDISELNIKKGMILLYPIKLADQNIQVIEFQVIDLVAKANPNSGVLYSEYTVAPATNFAFRETEEYQNILNHVIESYKW